MKSAIALVDKPSGMSSAAVVAVLKRRLNKQYKIGHAGTLDPMASGLLVCMIGRATRLADYAQHGEKVYEGDILLGQSSDSDDITGTLSEKCSVPEFDLSELKAKFEGEIEQVPPRVSAVKVNGKRAYKLARAGKEMTLKSRRVSVSFEEFTRLENEMLQFRVRCSKGTYIRSLARDMGEELGCGAALARLRRVESKPFSVAQAQELDSFRFERVLPVDVLFSDAPRLELHSNLFDMIEAGNLDKVIKLLAGDLPSGDFLLFAEKSGKSERRAILKSEPESALGLKLLGVFDSFHSAELECLDMSFPDSEVLEQEVLEQEDRCRL